METNVQKSKEECHAEQGLKVEPKEERETAGDSQDASSHRPVDVDPVGELVGQNRLVIGFEVDNGGIADHVEKNSVHVHHEIYDRRSVEVPEIE